MHSLSYFQNNKLLLLTDIGANLTDPMFRGLYGGSQKHQDDLQLVLDRSWKQGLQKMIITVGTLNEADEALEMANKDGMYIEVCNNIYHTTMNSYIVDC